MPEVPAGPAATERILLKHGGHAIQTEAGGLLTSRLLIFFLLFLAAVQCGRSVFLVNDSYLDLRLYASGGERMPYQGRIAMMPVLRWAGRSAALGSAAASIGASQERTPRHIARPEPMSPEKLICVLLGCISVLAMTFGATWYTWRHLPELWWLGGVVVVVILNASYASRAELNLWYPYDLPHFAVFGLATLFLLEGAWAPFFALFLLDLPIRETSIYLSLLASAVAYQRRHFKVIGLVAAVVLFAWLPLRLAIVHHFANNPGETGVRPIGILHAVADPLHWPQVASAGGFLFLPLWMARKYLTDDQRIFMLAALPCLVVTLIFGMWYESRIFGEWTVALSVLLCQAFAGWLDSRRRARGGDSLPY